MRQSERLDTILERLYERGSVAVTGLARDLGVSMATIRRDLERLESQRLLSRTHGGAVSHGVLYELPLRYRAGRHEAEKHRIAEAAASRLGDARVVGLTGGVARPESYELVGPLADATLNHLNLDVVFVGVDGASRAGMTTHHEVEA